MPLWAVRPGKARQLLTPENGPARDDGLRCYQQSNSKKRGRALKHARSASDLHFVYNNSTSTRGPAISCLAMTTTTVASAAAGVTSATAGVTCADMPATTGVHARSAGTPRATRSTIVRHATRTPVTAAAVAAVGWSASDRLTHVQRRTRGRSAAPGISAAGVSPARFRSARRSAAPVAAAASAFRKRARLSTRRTVVRGRRERTESAAICGT